MSAKPQKRKRQENIRQVNSTSSEAFSCWNLMVKLQKREWIFYHSLKVKLEVLYRLWPNRQRLSRYIGRQLSVKIADRRDWAHKPLAIGLSTFTTGPHTLYVSARQTRHFVGMFYQLFLAIKPRHTFTSIILLHWRRFNDNVSWQPRQKRRRWNNMMPVNVCLMIIMS